MGGINPILEGDSFLAIQWGSGKAIYLWRLADWVEEVQDISRKKDASFLIILREPRAMADRLAREGVSRSSFLLMLRFF